MVVVVVARVIMAGVIARTRTISRCKLLGSTRLCLRIQIFDLCFTKDAKT
jgi:hypothetical protein